MVDQVRCRCCELIGQYAHWYCIDTLARELIWFAFNPLGRNGQSAARVLPAPVGAWRMTLRPARKCRLRVLDKSRVPSYFLNMLANNVRSKSPSSSLSLVPGRRYTSSPAVTPRAAFRGAVLLVPIPRHRPPIHESMASFLAGRRSQPSRAACLQDLLDMLRWVPDRLANASGNAM